MLLHFLKVVASKCATRCYTGEIGEGSIVTEHFTGDTSEDCALCNWFLIYPEGEVIRNMLKKLIFYALFITLIVEQVGKVCF